MGTAAASLPRLARYEILSRIGAGGMAEVYLARAPGLGRARRSVAIKRMHPHLADSREFVELFFREAQVASTLDHPNLVAVTESGEEDGQYFLVMEYVDGVSLRQLISRVAAPFDVAVAVSIAMSMCAGLHHAHERSDENGRPLEIVHRDVSPGNVFVSYDGAVKLGDFGVATATSAWTSMQSSTGTIRGKVAYMAPEQARGDTVDRRADVFAVGNVLFEMLTGRRLLQARGEVELLHELVFGAYGEPRIDRADCPPALAEIVARALQRDADERFATALEMERALEAVAREHALFAPPSAIADFVTRFAPRPDDETDPTRVRATPAVVAPPSPDAPTQTVDHVTIDDTPRPRGRAWLAIPIVAALGIAAAWLFSAPEPSSIERIAIDLDDVALGTATPRFRLAVTAAEDREPAGAVNKPSKSRRKAKRRAAAAAASRSNAPRTRKPPQGESLFPNPS